MSFTPLHLYFEDIEVGQEWESPGRTLTEADIVNFAGLSGDFNPIHVNHEFAKTTLFRRPVAHGLLVQAMGSGLGLYSPPMRTLALLEVRTWQFKAPVFAGDTIRVRTRVLDKEVRSRGKRAVVTWQRQFVNQEGKVVQEGVTLTVVEGRAAARSEADGDEPRVEDRT
jgi:3-hydroxybutyryl-CoA dehydratase